MDYKAARRYLGRVKRGLVCGWEDRRHLLARCTVMIDDYQQENPEAGYDGLVDAFGEPAAFAAVMLAGLGEAKVRASKRRQRLERMGAAAAVIAVLAVMSVFWYARYRYMVIDDSTVRVIRVPEYVTPAEFRAKWDCMLRKEMKDRE